LNPKSTPTNTKERRDLDSKQSFILIHTHYNPIYMSVSHLTRFAWRILVSFLS